MKSHFPPKNQNYQWLQTNRSDDFGSLWSTMNLDFQTNLGVIRLSQKLVTNTTSSDDADLGLPVAFEFFSGIWWAICGTRVFKNTTGELTSSFVEDTSGYTVGSSTSQFDVTNPAGTTFRYTFDGTGTDPGITALTFPIGATVIVADTNMAAGNEGTFTVTGSGANYFEVTNAAGVVEADKTIGSGFISVSGGTLGQDYSTVVSDMTFFNDKLWTTSTLKLRSKAFETGTPSLDIWTTEDTLTSSSAIHKLAYFNKFDRLYYINSNTNIRSIDTSDAVASSGNFTFTPSTTVGRISSIISASNYIWIGTFRTNNLTTTTDSGTKGSILQWDGFSSQATNEFVIETGGILAFTVLDDTPYAIDSSGRILKYSGYSFIEIARLPIDRILLTNATESASNKFIHFNGFVSTYNNTLQVLINNLNEDASGNINENLPSGIWELDLATLNFTHRYSPTLKARSSSSITDFGQNRISVAGALKCNYFQSSNSNGRSTLIAGFTYFTDASSTKSAIYIDSPAQPNTDNEGQKKGYFVTTWFNSEEVEDKWSRLWAVYRRLLNSSDKIVFKYRLNEETPTYATITWVNTTSFTTTTDITAYGPTATGFNGTTGGEVEVLQGTGSGACVHITNIVNNGGTYTVTVDDTVTGVTTGTAKARFQKWIKLFPEITGQVLSWSQMAINANNTRIQIKCCLTFTGDDEFHKFILVSNEDIKSNL